MVENQKNAGTDYVQPSPLRILIVEDNPRDADLEIATLKRAGYQLTYELAPSAEVFRQMLSDREFDIILADFNLRDWTGLDALEILKEFKKDIPFIIVTGSLGDETAVDCIKEGAADYVLKDRLARLPLAVRRALHEKALDEGRRRSEDALLRNEARFRSLIANSTDMISLVSQEGSVLFASPSVTKYLGYPVSSCEGKELLHFVHTEDRDCVIEVFKKIFNHPAQVVQFGYRCRHQDGTWRWIETYAQNLLDDASVQAIILNCRDITDRRTAEEKLRRSEEQFRLISESVDDLIAVLDLDGKRLYNSPSYKRILGDPENLRGTDSFNEIHPDDREKIRKIFEDTVRTGIGQRAEFRFMLKDGSVRFIESQGSVIRDRDGKPSNVVVVSRDVTERKALEMQLIQAQRMEAVGRLAGGVAHDFNNLLTVINGYADLLEGKFAPDSDEHTQVEEIRKAGARSAGLTRQLLAFSRKQVLVPQILDLNLLIEDLHKMLHRLISEDIVLITSLAPDLGKVKADPGQIEQVVMNLVVNARDAMPHGGQLMVETSNINLDESYCRAHTEAKPGHHVMLAVSDSGAGMDKETQARIFEPFFTTKPEGKGTGLGLATVYGIVKQSEGSIWVYSEVGRGTSFKIYLPRIIEDRPATKARNLRAGPARGTETILLSEDDPAVRMLVRETLKSAGYTVLEAPDGNTALTVASGHSGKIHLLLTDVVMPQLSGRELAERLHLARADTKVIFMSGYTDDAVIRFGVLNPGTHFLQKPFAPVALLQKVREVLDLGTG